MTWIKNRLAAREHLWPVVVLAFALPLVVFWYTPAFLYSSNAQQYHFPLRQVLPILAVPFVIAGLGLSLPAVVMSPTVRRFYGAFLACLTVYTWVQGYFLVRDYGLLDGDVSLPAYTPEPLFIGAAFVFGATLLIAKIQPVRLMTVFSVVMAILLVHMTTIVLADDRPARVVEPATYESLYELGEENLLVILLDSLQSDVFEDVIQEHPDLAESLKGFTYYPNTLGAAPTTYGALPAIHSGRQRADGQSMAEFFERSIARDSFDTALAANGWKVTHINPVAAVCPEGVDRCFTYDATARASSRTRLLQQSASMLDLSLFRLAPAELKAAVYNADEWRVSGSFDVVSIQEGSDTAMREFTQALNVGDAPKTAKFLHLQSTHPPATRAADCSVLPTPISPMTRRAALDVSTCALTRLKQLIDKLQVLGQYESTSIVLLSDHGYLEMGSKRVTDERWTKLIGSANPLLAVKPAGASGAYRSSDAALSVADVKTIVCTLTRGCDPADPDWDEPDPQRVRRYMDYKWGDVFWYAHTLKDERHYEVRGPMFDTSSWKDLGPPRLPTVDQVTFDSEDHAGHFGFGWGPIEDGSRWAKGVTSTLYLDLPRDRDSRLVFDVGTLPELKGQTLSVKVNLTPVGTVKVEGDRATVSFDVPRAEAAKAGIDELHLISSKHLEGDPSLNRHVRKAEQRSIRFDELRIG